MPVTGDIQRRVLGLRGEPGREQLLSQAATARVGRHRDAHLDDITDAVESHLPDRSVTLESDQVASSPTRVERRASVDGIRDRWAPDETNCSV